MLSFGAAALILSIGLPTLFTLLEVFSPQIAYQIFVPLCLKIEQAHNPAFFYISFDYNFYFKNLGKSNICCTFYNYRLMIVLFCAI